MCHFPIPDLGGRWGGYKFAFYFVQVSSRYYFLFKDVVVVDDKEGRQVVEQDFHRNFQVNVTWIFTFSSGVLD